MNSKAGSFKEDFPSQLSSILRKSMTRDCWLIFQDILDIGVFLEKMNFAATSTD